MYCKGKPLGCASHAREPQTKHVNAAAVRSKQETATTWRVPKLVSEVKFTNGRVKARCAILCFLGCAPTKKASDVIREQA
jgi:hypothetical protein